MIEYNTIVGGQSYENKLKKHSENLELELLIRSYVHKTVERLKNDEREQFMNKLLQHLEGENE